MSQALTGVQEQTPGWGSVWGVPGGRGWVGSKEWGALLQLGEHAGKLGASAG